MRPTSVAVLHAAPLALALFAAACSSEDEAPPAWQVVQEKLPGGLLRVWGTSANDVYAVGADGDGQGSLALHYDGTAWRRLDTGTHGDLWWVYGVGPDDVRMVGEAGLALRYRPSTGAFEPLTMPEAVTLFGVWGSSPTDVWYVGGAVGQRHGVVWHDDGTGARAPLATLTTTTATLFKVHGTSADDVWLVGEQGVAMHWDGATFTQPSTGQRFSLFTVHGTDASHVWAVGGGADGVILSWDGSAWVNETPPETPQLNAVWAPRSDLVYTAGFNGRVYRKDASGWGEVKDVPTFQDLHSVWTDEAGGLWACGGQLASDPPKSGVLVHFGKAVATGLAAR